VIVDVPPEPAATETEEGEAEMESPGPVVTFKVTTVLFMMRPPVPVTVMG